MIEPASLKSTVLAVGLSDAQLAALAAHGSERRFVSGETMLQPEDGTHTLMVLIEGECDVLGVMDDEINHLSPGMLLGEVAFFDRQARSAKAVAKSDCSAVVFDANFIASLQASDPALATQLLLNVIGVLCKKLRQATRWIDAGHV